jgi:RNA polymerase sigma-70 factor (ECF subfamily)
MTERCSCSALVAAMRTHLDSSVSEGYEADAIQQWFIAGQRKWPGVSVTLEAFAQHCRGAIQQDSTLPVEPTDLYLCCACAEGNPEALRSFEREGLQTAQQAIRRIDASEEFVHDTLQELWSKVLVGQDAKVRSYSGRGPLMAWLRVAATRVALDRRRAQKRGALREVALSDSLAGAPFSPEAEVLRARYGAAFSEALRAALAGLSRQERNVLRMHVGQCSIDEIGRAYGVHRATAARWIERARSKIHERVRELLRAEHALTDSEFKSLAGLMGAELELSLTQASSRAQTLGAERPE